MEYITTKKQCQKQIDKYKNVCRGCGGKLTPIETVDNSDRPTFWIGCKKCTVFDNGCNLNEYKIAKKMVIEKHFRFYHKQEPDKNREPEKYNYWLTSQIRGTCRIVNDVLSYNIELIK